MINVKMDTEISTVFTIYVEAVSRLKDVSVWSAINIKSTLVFLVMYLHAVCKFFFSNVIKHLKQSTVKKTPRSL